MGNENGGSLIFKLGLWTKEFDEKSALAGKKLGEIGATLNNAFSVAQGAAVIGFMQHLIDRAGQLQDVADQLDISAESMQALDARARDAGISANTLGNAYNTLKGKSADLASGNKEVSKALASLNLNTKEFLAMPTDRQLEAIAQGYAKAEDKGKAWASVVDLIGQRNAPRLNAILKQLGEEGLDSIIEKSKEAGQVMDEAVLKRMDAAGDSITNVKNRIQNFFTGALVQFTSGLGYLAAGVVNKIQGIDTAWEDTDLVIKKTDAAVKQLNVGLAGTKATSEEIKKFQEAAAEAEEKQVLSKMENASKILYLEDKILATVVEASKWEENTKEWIAQQNILIKTQSDLDQVRLKQKEEINARVKSAGQRIDAAQQKEMERAEEKIPLEQRIKELEDARVTIKREMDALDQRTPEYAEKAALYAEFGNELAERKGELQKGNLELAMKELTVEQGRAKALQMSQKALESIMFQLTNGGLSTDDISNASEAALREKLKRNNEQLNKVSGVFATDTGISWGNSLDRKRLENENERIKKNLALRDQIQFDVGFLGVEGARSRPGYDPIGFDKLVQQYVTGQSEQQKTNDILTDIQRRLAPIQGTPYTTSLQDIGSKLDRGFQALGEQWKAQSNRG